jgi:hypothetical protein
VYTLEPIVTTTSTVTDVVINRSLPEDDVVMDDATPNPTGADPNIMKPSTPSTYLSHPSLSTSSAAVTSVSRGKRKASGVDSTSAMSDNHKRSRPLSVTAQAQVDGSDAMRRLATVLEAMLEERDQKPLTMMVPQPTTMTQAAAAGPSNLNSTIVTQNSRIIDQASDILISLSLPPDQTNAISAYMQNPANINNVQFFIKFNQESRDFWIKEVLNEIWSARAKRAQIE